jgi:hypothetical protein
MSIPNYGGRVQGVKYEKAFVTSNSRLRQMVQQLY